MADVQIKEIQSLTLDEVQKNLPTSYQICSLEKADVGKQKRNTIVIGEVLDVQHRKTQHTGKQPAIRLKLKEVLPKNNGLRFDVVIFGKTVNLIEDVLNSKSSCPLWIGFSNLLVVKYTGQEEPWCPFGLKVEDTEKLEKNDSNSKQEIKFFYQHSKPKELPIVYSTLNDIKNKIRINVFVVVTSIIKQPVVLCNKTKHIMLSLIDPSCEEPSATYKDIPLHIFLNDAFDRFPEPFQRGDILRIRDMLGDLFSIENKMFGKIFHSKSVVKFIFKEDDKVIPKTTNSTYALTGQDEKIARQLRQWWLKYLEKEEKANNYVDPLLLEKKICEITSPCTFNLICLIKDVRVVEAHNVVLLRVTDGTRSIVMTTFNFNDATQEFSSQAEQIETAVYDSEEIVITVFQPLLEKASGLKAGDMVQLINVTCVDVVGNENESNDPIIDFYMKDEECEIRNVLENSSISRQLLRSLSGKISPSSEERGKRNFPIGINGFQENSRTKDDESKPSPLLSQLQKNINPHNFSLTPLKSVASNTSNTIIEESPSPSLSPRLLIETNERDIEESLSYPAVSEEVDLSNSAIGDATVCENGRSSRITSGFGVRSVPMGKGKLRNTKVKKIIGSLSKSIECEAVVTSKPKRKLFHAQASSSEPKNKITSYVWQQAEVDTICNTYTKTSLTEFYNNSNPDDTGRVWAMLKHIHISSNKLCDKCENISCYHDWIWGLCITCGTTFPSTDLRNHFSENDLLTFETLPCFLCSSDTEPTAIIEPYFKLSLCLEDMNNGNCYSLDLSGDDAELFFGVKATFRWLVESVPASFHNQTSIFTRLNSFRPFQYCLINNSKDDGSRCIRICDTKLNF